jgi:hypothetical protein
MTHRRTNRRRPMCRRLGVELLESRQVLSTIGFLQESADLYSVSRNASDLGEPIVPIYTNFNAWGDYRDPAVFADGVELDGNDPNADDVNGGTSSWRMTLLEPGKTGWFQFNIGSVLRDIPEFGDASQLRFKALGDAAGQQLKVKVIGDLPGGVSEMYWIRDLSTGWADYAVTLPDGLGLSRIDAVQFVLGDGFNQGSGTVRLDEVRLGIDGYDPLRLAQSYRAGGWIDNDPAPPKGSVADRDLNVYPKTVYLYDQALTIKALLAIGRFQTACDLADAIMVTGVGGSYFNERVAGHVLQGDGTAVPPLSQKRTLGDNAWFGLALIDLYRALKDPDPAQALDYLTRARAISDWAESELKDTGPWGGYRGGFDKDGIAYDWRSVEQNLDTFQLNRWLAAELSVLGDVAADTYLDRARHAGDFVMYMFEDSEEEGMFWTGTGSGDTINTASVPLDTQLWSILTLSTSTDYADRIDWTEPLLWAETYLQTTDGVYEGFTFSSGSTPGIVWFEGTAHAALVYSLLGQESQYAELMETLDNAQDVHPYGDGSGLVAASRDGLADPAFQDIVFDSRLHLAATAWYFFAKWQINPFGPYVEVGARWHNPVEPLDVNSDGYITPIDALLVINYMNRNFGDPTPPADEPPPPYCDVNGDNYITPIDALQVINYLNRKEGEGEDAGGADRRYSTGSAEIAAQWVAFVPDDLPFGYPGRRIGRRASRRT